MMRNIHKIREPYREVIKRFFNLVKEYFHDDLVSFIIYGSVARGEQRKDSDIDILIIVSRNLPKSRLKRSEIMTKLKNKLDPLILKMIDQGYGISISTNLKTVDEATKLRPIYLDMIEDAIILYDKDSFFRKILDELRRKLNELGAEKVYIGRKWYWRLKKDYKFGDEVKI